MKCHIPRTYIYTNHVNIERILLHLAYDLRIYFIIYNSMRITPTVCLSVWGFLCSIVQNYCQNVHSFDGVKIFDKIRNKDLSNIFGSFIIVSNAVKQTTRFVIVESALSTILYFYVSPLFIDLKFRYL